jgi:hypothetical protein
MFDRSCPPLFPPFFVLLIEIDRACFRHEIERSFLMMADFMNLKIKSVQSFRYTYRNMMCVHMFIEINIYIYMNICVCTMFSWMLELGLCLLGWMRHKSRGWHMICTTKREPWKRGLRVKLELVLVIKQKQRDSTTHAWFTYFLNKRKKSKAKQNTTQLHWHITHASPLDLFLPFSVL